MGLLARGLKALMLASLALAVPLALFARGRPGVAASCGAALLAALFLPRLLPRRGLRLAGRLELVWLLPFSLAWGLGEGWALFERMDWWDDLTHFCAGAAFFALFLAWGRGRVGQARPALALAALLAALAIGALWEIGEFASDRWVGTATQAGNDDTMADLVCDLGGALGAASAWWLARALRRPQAPARTASGS